MNKLQTTLAVQAATMFLCLLSVSIADAEIRTITATGEYRMGDNDTRTDAKRLALLDAKRLALEQAGTYIESITEVKNFDLTKEEIRAYTAGIVEVVEQLTKDIMEGSTHIIRVDVTAKIETDVVARQIDALRKNEDVKSKLLQAEYRAHKLQRELEIKTQELAAAKSKAEIQGLVERRRQIIARIEAEELVERARDVLIGPWRDKSVTGSPPANTFKYARSLLDQALLLNPDYGYAHFWMGYLLEKEGDLDGGITEYRTALRLMPEEWPLYVNLGMALRDKGDLDGAIAAFRTALRLKPDFVLAHSRLGLALTDKGDLEGAIGEIRTALRREPDLALPLKGDLALAHVGLARALAETGNRAGAIAALRTALRLAPHIAVGLIVAFESALRERPDDAWAQIGLGFALDGEGNRAGAITAFRAGLRLQPDDAWAHFGLGRALQKTGRAKEAAEEFREFLRLAPDTPVSPDLITEAHAALRELER